MSGDRLCIGGIHVWTFYNHPQHYEPPKGPHCFSLAAHYAEFTSNVASYLNYLKSAFTSAYDCDIF